MVGKISRRKMLQRSPTTNTRCPHGIGGIGGRDAMRAGWKKDVGDLEYVTKDFKDPSDAPFSWWYASVAGQMKEKMKLTERWSLGKIFVILVLSKILAKVPKIVDEKTLKIFACAMLAKMAISAGKISFLCGKMLARISKIEFCMNMSGGNHNSLMFYQGQKLAKIEERIQDQSSSPNDCGRKITTYMWESLLADRDVPYMLCGIDRIKDIYMSARCMTKDCALQQLEKEWFKLFDGALEILQAKMSGESSMTAEIYQKIQEVQRQEIGVTALCLERFGPEAGRTDPVPPGNRRWIQ